MQHSNILYLQSKRLSNGDKVHAFACPPPPIEFDKEEQEENCPFSLLKPDGTCHKGDIQKALLSYFIIVLMSFIILIKIARLRIWSALIVSMVVGQIALNVLFLPVRLDFWAEFNSFIALYSMIQVGTPILVLIYTIASAFSDHNNGSVVIHPSFITAAAATPFNQSKPSSARDLPILKAPR